MLYAWLIFLLTLGTGLVWLVDVLVRRRRRRAGTSTPLPGFWRVLVDNSRGFFPFLLAIFLIRSFVVEPFNIPSGSMMPSILVGDFVVTEKFAYELHLPIVHTRLVRTGRVQRGDVIVFRFPPDPKVDFIKRVIGLPGDTIRYTCNNQLIVNGNPVRMQRIGIYPGEGKQHRMGGALLYKEWLPRSGGRNVENQILIMPDRPTVCGRSWMVPKGHYFVMGDNRDDSDDSRYWGFVPARNIVGKAVAVFFNFQGWTNWPLWNRIGTRLR